jgi:hypothetical protein
MKLDANRECTQKLLTTNEIDDLLKQIEREQQMEVA